MPPDSSWMFRWKSSFETTAFDGYFCHPSINPFEWMRARLVVDEPKVTDEVKNCWERFRLHELSSDEPVSFL